MPILGQRLEVELAALKEHVLTTDAKRDRLVDADMIDPPHSFCRPSSHE